MTDGISSQGADTSRPQFLGFGLALRVQHYQDVLHGDTAVDWFEIISEDYMAPGGQAMRVLGKLRERYPIVMHGVSMSIASTAPLNIEYLQQIRRLAERVEPCWISDHLCWTGVHGINLHDLLPIPYTQEALEHIASRIHQAQDILGRTLTIENVSTYVRFAHSEMTEWEFLAELTRRTGCWLLLDVNNIYVSGFNHGFDPLAFIAGTPRDRVIQIHLAGHSQRDGYIIDTHDAPVSDAVWALYRAALDRFGPVSTNIERDDNIPPIHEMILELDKARTVAAASKCADARRPETEPNL